MHTQSRSMKRFNLFLHSVVLTGLIASCSADFLSKETTSVAFRANADVSQPQTITVTSQDGIVQLTLPNDWQDIWTEANQEQWSLLVGKRSAHTQLGVRSIAKADYPEITAEAHAQAALIAAKSPFTDAQMVEEGQSVTVNGHPAVRYQTKGTISGQRLAALSLSVETPDYYHAIFVVGSETAFAEQQEELNHIIQSLEEN